MSIEQFIENEVRSNDIVLFMKGTPQFPQCGFSSQLVQILEYVGVPYRAFNVHDSADLRDGSTVSQALKAAKGPFIPLIMCMPDRARPAA